MSNIGLSVPLGLTITTATYWEYNKAGNQVPNGLWDDVIEALKRTKDVMDAKLGDLSSPLLLSVRFGVAISMSGMMDIVLNLGLNDEVVDGLASRCRERFAYDSYHWFIDMFGDVVMDVSHSLFEDQLESMKAKKGVNLDTDLTIKDLKELVVMYKDVYRKAKGIDFPMGKDLFVLKSLSDYVQLVGGSGRAQKGGMFDVLIC